MERNKPQKVKARSPAKNELNNKRFDSEKHNGFVITLKTGEVLTFTCEVSRAYPLLSR